MTEPILDQVRRRLNELRGWWPKISLDTNVEYDTIAKIAQGKRPNPELRNIQPLLDWFEAWDEMQQKVRKVS